MAEKDRDTVRGAPSRRENRTPQESSYRDTNNPFGFMRRFVEQMDSLFDDFGFGGRSLSPRIELGRGSEWAPEVDVFERDRNVVIRVDLPGMKREDIQVELQNDSICISGDRRQEEERKEQGWHRVERRYGSFCRTIALPEGADLDKAQAAFRDGVLEVTVPMPEQKAARRIEITEGSRPQQSTGQHGRAAS